MIIWDALEYPRLTTNALALDAINQADADHALIVSDISLWEISMFIKNNV
ncbi:MAG: hypothetical protein H6936_08220 [Burkholderiales bacterium]|nr:hypothetical protein [Burkholderiales bacterium]